MSEFGAVERCEIDGVATFRVDSGRPTLTAALVVRQGMVDELLPTTGWTHLLEHLALHDRASGALHANGSVSLVHTRFDGHGPADRVAQMLTGVSQWLADPAFPELAREQSVLRAEAAVRGIGEVNGALLQRYGAQGPGLAGHSEPGLSRATAESLRQLALRAFVTDNCALFLDGPPPPALRMELPAGPRQPVPPAMPCDDPLPAAYVVHSGIALSGVVQRSVAATFLPHLLREVLTAEFRERDGGAYAPWSHYEPVDAQRALVLCGSDANEVLLRTIASRALSQLGHVAQGEFRQSLLTDIRDQLVQAARDPYNLPGLAYRAATDHLRGEPPRTLEEAVAEIEAVTVDDVVAEAAAMQATLLVAVDGQARWDKEVPMLAMPSGPERIRGRTHRSRNFPANRDVLVVGDQALQVGASKEYRTLRQDEVAGLFAYPDGAREVVALNGWSIRVEPTIWSAGRAAVQEVDSMVPVDLHIPMLERDRARVPQPASLPVRLQHVVRERGGWRFVAQLGLWVVWLALIVVYTVYFDGTPAVPIAVLLATLTVRRVRARRQV